MPSWKLKRSLTKGDLVQFCLDLSELFSSEFQAEYRFRPLSRCEGGIECHVWPGKRDGQYKQVRWVFDFSGWENWVPTDWREAWASEAERDKVIVKHLRHVYTEKDLPDCAEKHRAKFVKQMNSRQTANRMWFKGTDTKWKTKERLLLMKYMKEAGVL